jgi:hypothetical protein
VSAVAGDTVDDREPRDQNGLQVATATDVLLSATGPTTINLSAYQTAPMTLNAIVRNADVYSRAVATVYRKLSGRQLVLEGTLATSASGTFGFAPLGHFGGEGLIGIVLSSMAPTRATDVVQVVSSTPTSLDIDANTLLPELDGTMDTNATRPTVTWTASRPLIADVAAVTVRFGPQRDWITVGPAAPGTVRFAEVPSDLIPTGTPVLRQLFVQNSDGVDGYDVMRNTLRDRVLFQPSQSLARSQTVY